MPMRMFVLGILRISPWRAEADMNEKARVCTVQYSLTIFRSFVSCSYFSASGKKIVKSSFIVLSLFGTYDSERSLSSVSICLFKSYLLSIEAIVLLLLFSYRSLIISERLLLSSLSEEDSVSCFYILNGSCWTLWSKSFFLFSWDLLTSAGNSELLNLNELKFSFPLFFILSLFLLFF